MIYEQETNIYQNNAIKTDIDSAKNTANGKNRRVTGPNNPGTNGFVAGDIWFQNVGGTGQDADYIIAVYNFNGTSWEQQPLTSAAFAYIDAVKITTGMLQGTNTNTRWNLDTGEFQTNGDVTVTAQVETAEGVYTPQTYDVDHITRISGGLLRLLATIDDAQTQTELFSLGLAGEGMSYDFYKDNNDSGSTFSYPYAGLNFNAPTVTGKSGIIWTQNRGTTATYTPYAHISPDTLVLGGYKNLVTQIAGEVPNRNPLHLNGGWVSPENAIFLEQHYQIVEIPGGTSKEWYDFKRRVAWEICPGDNLEIGMWRGAGIYSNSKKDIRITIPLCRPISADVKTIEVFCTVNRAWQQGTAIVSANVDTSGSVVESWNLTGVVVSIRKDDGTAWSGTSTGTNNAPIAVQLLNLQLIFWGDEFSE